GKRGEFRSRFSGRPGEFVYAERISTDEQAIFLDEEHVGFDARAVLGVNLILGTPVSLLVEVEQGVVQGEPKVAVDRIHAECGENGPKGRRFSPLFLVFNFPAPGASLGKGIDTRKLKILFGETEPVVLADQRLG